MPTPYAVSYVVSTGQIETFGPVPFIAIAGPGEAVDVIPDGPPDVIWQRYDASEESRLRVATTQERASALAAQATAQATQQLQRGLLAVMATMFKDRTGSFPSVVQRTQLKDDFITAWRALG